MSPKRIKKNTVYKSWDEHIHEFINANKDKFNQLSQSLIDIKFERLIKDPPLIDYLEHQESQYSLAVKNDRIVDARWRALNDTTISLRRALIDGRNSEIAMKLVAIGRAIEALQHPPRHMQIKMFKALESKQKSERPFKIKQERLRILKVCARSFAITRWSEDINKALRMMDMCHEVWPELVEISDALNFKDVLPDRAELLKSWIRPVAPDWAKKGGAPKK